MFGIGLPEMIVILAIGLIVVGPDKLPELARSLAKGIFELKKTVNQLKDSIVEETGDIHSLQSDLRKTGDDLRKDLQLDELPFRRPTMEERNSSATSDASAVAAKRPWEIDLKQPPTTEQQPESGDKSVPNQTEPQASGPANETEK